AYTLSRGGHVRADMLYRLWPCRTQAMVELTLYVLFFFPGILALLLSGWGYGSGAMGIREVSVNSPAGMPIWPMKMMIPVGGALMLLQGIAETLRCVLCLRDGQWPARLHDVEELENQLLEAAARKLAGERAAS
ncbi:MAG: TRAP transporter small permease subunit, partial [Betaproteobacteria bacterium]|nr:TRAP transporter small permease subunit [Betaproteobacteria bacterium]